jgi:poly-gamma-glutamate capsule biosynthesis protein CapA/YwtB (metallophosphatase superfamily)
VVLAAALLLPLLPGCSSPAAPSPPHGLASSSPAPASSSGVPSSTAPPEITLAFAGDVHFMERTLVLLDHPATAFGPVATVLSGADVAMVNLESAVTQRGTPEPKEFHFRAPTTAYQALAAAGVDVVSIGNNHALDYGRVGLLDTLDSAKAAGLPAIGAGRSTKEAYAPWVTKVKGVKIAFLAMSQIGELADSWAPAANRPGIAMAFNENRAIAAVKAAKKLADVVVVYVHWGTEGVECPNDLQRGFAASLAKAGATMVVGTHSHLLQGGGWLGQTFVQYGLGNFLWWRDDAWSNDTGVLRVTLHGTKIVKTELVPAVISRKTGRPVPVTSSEATRVGQKYQALRRCTGLSAKPTVPSM